MVDNVDLMSTIRRHGTMIGFGLVGVLGLVGVRITQLRVSEVRLSAVWQPLLVEFVVPTVAVVAAAIVGVWTNDVTGFRSKVYDWADNGQANVPTREGLVVGVAAGIGIGLLAAGFDLATRATAVSTSMPYGLFGLLALGRIVYLSIATEIVLRWGVLSLIVYSAVGWFRVDGSEPDRRYVVTGAIIVLAATMAFVQTTGTVDPIADPLGAMSTGALNLVPGVVFGAIFWRYSLEIAMVAHASSHLPLIVVALLA